MCTIVDLSLEIFDKAKTFDLDPQTEITQHQTIETAGYNISRLSISSHLGTHVDAPHHFLEDGKTVDKIEPLRFVGTAIKIDFRNKKAGHYIDVEDLVPYKNKFSKDKKIILWTDWSRQYGKDIYFSQFPQLTIAAAEWIANTEIGLLGIETPSVNAKDYVPIHKILLGKQIVILEGLNNLSEIPSEEFKIIALPLRIRGCDGSPVRAVGIID